ncbi:MAG: 3-dehydroquinate synthase, partial [Planctomycetota bacterium]
MTTSPPWRALRVEAPGGGYAVELGPGLLARAGERLRAWGLAPGPVAVVSEDHLLARWGPALGAGLALAGFELRACPIQGGEQHKTLASAALLYERFAALELDRGAVVLALGGGVVGDLAGFAAATWLRGVPFVQAPTSLLAMVDSAVGGKTGVDLPQGKNLVGAFKQPAGVLIDLETLGTLPPEELRAGLAEVVKHALLASPALFARLEGAAAEQLCDPSFLGELVHDALAVKVAIVAADPLERGERALLNLGHTFGHAFERCSGYRLRHGEAVAVGLVAAAELAERLGRATPGHAARVQACLARLGLPTCLPGYDPAAVRAPM